MSCANFSSTLKLYYYVMYVQSTWVCLSSSTYAVKGNDTDAWKIKWDLLPHLSFSLLHPPIKLRLIDLLVLSLQFREKCYSNLKFGWNNWSLVKNCSNYYKSSQVNNSLFGRDDQLDRMTLAYIRIRHLFIYLIG